MDKSTIGIIALGGIISLVVGTFILPTELNIERAVLVEAEAAEIYDHIADLSQWNDWEPWGTGTLTPQTTGVGAARGWPGGGELTLSELSDDEVHYQVHNLAMPASGFLALQDVEEGTAVVWVHQSQTGYGPVARMTGWAARGELALQLDDGLARLKAVSERQGAPSRNLPPGG